MSTKTNKYCREICLVVACLLAVPLLAKEKKVPPAREQAKALSEIVIRGQIEKPEAFFILTPKEPDFLKIMGSGLRLEATQKIIEETRNDVFREL